MVAIDLGARMFRTVEAYSDIGDHRSGTHADALTIDWMIAEMASIDGAAVTRRPYDFDRYDTRWEVRLDGEPVTSIPLFYEGVGAVKTDRPVTASLAVLAGSAVPELEPIAAQALADGRTAAVVATQTGTGLLCALNRRPVPGSGLLTICVAGSLADRINDARVEVEIEANVVAGSTANVHARVGDGPDAERVMLTTPLSGWFRCAGERGTGIAVFLEVARTLAAEGVPLSLVVTNGHELSGLGVHRYLEDAVPEKAIFHFGASVASGDADGISPPRSRTRQLRPAGWIGESRSSELSEALAPLGATVRLPSDAQARRPEGWVGESARWAPLGKPLVSIAGGFPLHHAPEDLPSAATTPQLLEESYRAALAAARLLASVC